MAPARCRWRNYLGFADANADAARRRMRLKQSDLVGPAGYVSLEEGHLGRAASRRYGGQVALTMAPTVILTTGAPNGIGPKIALKAAI